MSEEIQTGAEALEVLATEAPAVESAEAKPEPKVYTQEEVDRIAAKVRTNAAHRAKREAEVEIYKSLATKQQEPESIPDAEPKRENFDDYESYVEARAEWKAIRVVDERLSKQSAERAQAEQAKTQAGRYESSAAAVRAETLDFDAVVSNAQMPVTREIRDAILESDSPARLQYHLAKNPGELDRILSLSPVQQIKAIGAMEAQLSSPARTTKAPAPVRPVAASGAGVIKSWDKMTMAEVKAQMRANGEL